MLWTSETQQMMALRQLHREKSVHKWGVVGKWVRKDLYCHYLAPSIKVCTLALVVHIKQIVSWYDKLSTHMIHTSGQSSGAVVMNCTAVFTPFSILLRSKWFYWLFPLHQQKWKMLLIAFKTFPKMHYSYSQTHLTATVMIKYTCASLSYVNFGEEIVLIL